MIIYLINKSTVLSDSEVESLVGPYTKFIHDVRVWWPRPVDLRYIDKANEPHLAWKVIFADTSDEAGALGYHDFTADGRPISYVFAGDCQKYGYSETVCGAHEIAEMIADPWISQVFQIDNTHFFAQEIADPCENDEDGYEIDGVQMSDFVTPRWFVPGSEGYVLDHTHKITKPLELLPGGYMSVFTSGRGWDQIYARQMDGHLSGAKGHGKDKHGHETKYSRLFRYGRDRGSLTHADTGEQWDNAIWGT